MVNIYPIGGWRKAVLNTCDTVQRYERGVAGAHMCEQHYYTHAL